jgi:hypothetical protein
MKEVPEKVFNMIFYFHLNIITLLVKALIVVRLFCGNLDVQCHAF